MNYTNTTETNDKKYEIMAVVFVLLFMLSIIISIVLITNPDKFCNKNKVNAINDMKYNNPLYYYTEIFIDEPNIVCPICIEQIKKGEDICITDCKHYYHKDCLLQWFNNSYDCPLCKNIIYDIYDVNLI